MAILEGGGGSVPPDVSKLTIRERDVLSNKKGAVLMKGARIPDREKSSRYPLQ